MNINTNTTKRIWNTISQDNRMDRSCSPIFFKKGVLLKIFSPFFQFPHLQSSSGSIQTKLALPVLYAWYCRNRTRLCPQTP